MKDELKTNSQLIEELKALQQENAQLEKSISVQGHGLKEQVERGILLENFLEASTAVIYRCIPEENYSATFISSNIKRQMGYEPDEFTGDPDFWASRIHPEDKERVFNRLSDVTERGYHRPEYRFLHKDGTYRWMLDTARVVYDDEGNPIDIVGNWIDITEKKKMEEELQKVQRLDSLGVLAGGIAHDFNNLLSVLFGFIDLAQQSVKDNDIVSGYLDNAMSCLSRARDLTQQLLTFAKGGMPVKENLSLLSVLKESSKLSLSGSNIRCDFIVQSMLWDIEADHGQLSQLFNNILLNARHAMPDGGVISIEPNNEQLKRSEVADLPEGPYLRILLKDQGIGIPKDIIPKVFDPFFTTKQAGSGLGLATSHSIVKNHGGHICLDSEMGIGTTVTVYLPATRETICKETETLSPTFGCTGRILIMDDEQMIRDMACQMLKRIGYEVVCVKNGEEAIATYEESMQSVDRFDAVILDLTVIGGMGGEKAIRKLLEIDANVRAIVSSGYSDSPVIANPREYGFIGRIVKPYKMREIAQVLNEVLKEE